MKLIILLAGVLVLSILITFSLLTAQTVFGTYLAYFRSLIPESFQIVTTFLTHSPGFWIFSMLFVIVLTILTFRYPREKGYALSIHALPFSKTEIFTTKLLSVYIFVLMLIFLPLLTIVVSSNVDVPKFIEELFRYSNFYCMLAILFYFLNFSIAVSVFFAVLLGNSFLDIMLSASILLLPMFTGLHLPPVIFVEKLLQSNMLTKLILSPNLVFYGLILPSTILVTSYVLFVRRDIL